MEIVALPGLLILCIVVTIITAEDEQTNCYKRFGNCDIAYPEPYRTIYRAYNEKTCLDFCASEKLACKGFVYDINFMVCNLYNNTDTPPAVLIPAFRKAFYKLTDSSCIAGYTGTPPVITLATYTPKYGAVTTSKLSTTTPSSFTFGPETPPTFATLGPETVGPGTQPPVGPTSAPDTTCGSGKMPVFIATGGKGVSGGQPSSTAPNIGDPSLCIVACSMNTDVNGKPSTCQSFVYDTAASQCSFYSTTPSSTSDQATQNLFVKSCVPSNQANSNCRNSLFPSSADTTLKNHVKKTVDAQTLADCLSACLSETSFKCLSANYNSNKKCDLNDASVGSAVATDLVQQTPGSAYIENTCPTRKLLLVKTSRRPKIGAVAKNLPTPRFFSPDNDDQVRTEIQSESSLEITENWSHWSQCRRDPNLDVRLRIRVNILCKLGVSSSTNFDRTKKNASKCMKGKAIQTELC